MKRNMPVRFIEVVGRATSLVAVWEGDCPKTHWQRHRAEIEIGRYPGLKMGEEPKQESRYVTEGEDVRCQYCGAQASVGTFLGASSSPLYSNGEKRAQPGDMYWAEWYHKVQEDGSIKCVYGWDNCTEPRGHLMVKLPNGCEWDIDSRASNCTMKEDKTHRCWVRHGEPPHVTADKNGFTCNAGAGSIVGGDWHGFLRNGVLEEC